MGNAIPLFVIKFSRELGRKVAPFRLRGGSFPTNSLENSTASGVFPLEVSYPSFDAGGVLLTRSLPMYGKSLIRKCSVS